MAAERFVGRERELGVLLQGLGEAASGRGALVLLVGEPGIGKSRLASEAAALAAGRGFETAWGRAWEAGGTPSYWPWVQCVRTLSRRRANPPGGVETGAADVLSELLPASAIETSSTSELSVPSESEGARLRLFEAVADFVQQAAQPAPVLLVLDDLHVADAPTLLLLHFVCTQLPRMPVFVVGALRGLDDAGDYARSVLAEVLREPSVRRLPLAAFTPGEVSEYVESAGVARSNEVVGTIHQRTGGNPLFVSEVVRLLEVEGDLADEALSTQTFRVPGTLREAIDRRLERLPADARHVLNKAAVLGREFRVDVLAGVTRLSEATIVSHLDAAGRVDVTAPLDARIGGQWRFSHVLVRELLYDELTAPARLQAHLDAAHVLERSFGSASTLAQAAHHAYLALPLGNRRDSAELAVRAGRRAVAELAYEEATRLFGMALDALAGEAGTAQEQCDVLLALGDAQARAGDVPVSRSTFLRAASVARAVGSAKQLAHAALGYGGRFAWMRAGSDVHLIPLLEEAISALGETEPGLRVRLLGRLAGALRDETSRERRCDVAGQALDLARRVADPDALAYALVARFTAIWGPDDLSEMAALVDELESMPLVATNAERFLEATWLRIVMLMTQGAERSALHQACERYRQLAEEIKQPSQRWYGAVFRTIELILDGDFVAAEHASHQTLALGRRAQDWDANASYRLELFAIRREQGRLHEVEDDIRRSVAEYPGYPLFRALLAQLFAETGRRERALSSIEVLVCEGDGALPRDNGWLFAMTALADACAAIEHRPLAAQLYTQLVAYGQQVGTAAGEALGGSTSRSLGSLARLLQHFDDAEAHLQHALAVEARRDALPSLARAQYELAMTLLTRNSPGDQARAVALLDEASPTAARFGMAALEQQITTARNLAETTSAGDRPGPAPAQHTRHAELHRHGELWTLRFAGEQAQLRDSKGLHYLAQLLAAPGAEIPAIDLVTSAGPVTDAAELPAGFGPPGDTGERLDATARKAYRRRIAQLDDELDEADRVGDPDRASRAFAERDFLLHELASAIGLGGRARRTGSAAERARVNVTRSIRGALSRVSKTSPAAGRHLEATIHTGTFCSYRPDPDAPIAWSI